MNNETRTHAQRLLLNAMLARGLPEQVFAVEQEEFEARTVGNDEERLASIVHTPFGAITLDGHEGTELVQAIYSVQVRAETTEALDALTGEIQNQVARTYGFEFEEDQGGRNDTLDFYWTEFTLRVGGDVVSVPEFRVEATNVLYGPASDPTDILWGPDSDPTNLLW